jgi:undecaprenyl-diphosphatase
MQMLLNWDEAVFHSINQFHHFFLDVLFLWVTQFNLENWIVLILLSTFLSKRKDRWKISLLAILLILTMDFFSHSILKPLFERPRPCETLEEVRLLVQCPKSSSFPSGHAMKIFGIAVFLGRYYPHWTGLLSFMTLMVSLSRIYIGVHYPLDIMGGAIAGTAFAFLWIKLERRLLTTRLIRCI